MNKSKRTINEVKCEENFLASSSIGIIAKNIEDFLIQSKDYIKGPQYNLKTVQADCLTNVVLFNLRMNCSVLIKVKNGKINHFDINDVYNNLKCIVSLENADNIDPPFAILVGVFNGNIIIQYVTLGMKSDIFISKFHFYLPMMEELKSLILDSTYICNN